MVVQVNKDELENMKAAAQRLMSCHSGLEYDLVKWAFERLIADEKLNSGILYEIKETLRENYRLKFGTDYAWVYKYGELRVMCHESFKDNIDIVLKSRGDIIVNEWFVFSTQGDQQ